LKKNVHAKNIWLLPKKIEQCLKNLVANFQLHLVTKLSDEKRLVTNQVTKNLTTKFFKQCLKHFWLIFENN
jgi:hypothetical protein